MEIRVFGAMRQTLGRKIVESPIEEGSVRAALLYLIDQHPSLDRFIFEETPEEQLRSNLRLFVNDEPADLDTTCGSEDRIILLPAMQGGSKGAISA